MRGLALLLTKGETVAPGTEITSIAATFISPAFTVLIFAALLAGFTGLLAARAQGAAGGGDAGADGPDGAAAERPVRRSSASAPCSSPCRTRACRCPVLFLLVVVVAISLLLRQTRFGRHLYAMGGNPVAARYAGIRTRRHTFTIFAIMGVLYGVAGLILVARLGSAPPNAATGLELNVIAAAVIGGTSLLGGVGTVAGAIMGALLMESLNNGMSLMNLPSYWQQIAVGFVLLVAVYLDVRSRREKT